MKAFAGLARRLLICGVLIHVMAAQEPDSAPTNAEAGPRIAQAVRVDRAPRLDGTLGDVLWELASPISDFKQREPFEGQPATERTEVKVLY